MSEKLTPERAKALYDILTHHETYHEANAFKNPGTILSYGPPFQDASTASTSPILQSLLSKFVLPLPGIRSVDKGFWTSRISPLMEELARAEFSESYERGLIGMRRTLAMGASALLEAPARGIFGGLKKVDVERAEDNYNPLNPQDVELAWRDFLQELVYGKGVEEIFEKASHTDQLTDHTMRVQSAHEMVVVNLASVLHYLLILNPEGPSVLTVVENVHKLIPYMIIRQTLKVGNVATMINAMVKLILTKVNTAAVTSWIGWGNASDEGMNLLQQIISTVIGWDNKALKVRADKIEKNSNAPSKEQLEAIREYVEKSREEHDACRLQSEMQPMSIAAVALATSSASSELSEAQHGLAQEYLTVQYSLRDRNRLERILCRLTPDLVTQAIREMVTAFDPVIRHVHNAVDLSTTLWDWEVFLTDLIKTAKLKTDTSDKSHQTAPSVEDFVKLLKRHMHSSHRFLHQVAKNGKDVAEWYKDYVKTAAAQFKVPSEKASSDSKQDEDNGAGQMTPHLTTLLSSLSPSDQEVVIKEIDAYTTYLQSASTTSSTHLATVLKDKSATTFGPGVYLAKWQALIDESPVTPATAYGPVRYGRDKAVKDASRVTLDGKAVESVKGADKVEGRVKPPDVKRTVELLGSSFREVLAGKGKEN